MNLRTLSDPSVESDSDGMYQSSRSLPKMRMLALFPSLTEDWAILDRLAGETNLSILIDHTANPSLSTTAGYRLRAQTALTRPPFSAPNSRQFTRISYFGLKISRRSEVGVAGTC